MRKVEDKRCNIAGGKLGFPIFLNFKAKVELFVDPVNAKKSYQMFSSPVSYLEVRTGGLILQLHSRLYWCSV